MLNFLIELPGLALCGLSIVMVLVGPRVDGHAERAFLRYYICLFLFTAANLSGQIMRGRPGAAIRAALYVSNFAEFLTCFLLFCVISQHLVARSTPEREHKVYRNFIGFFALAYTVSLVISQFTGLYYVIDAENVYRRAPGYPLCYAFAVPVFLLDIWLLVRPGGRMSRKGVVVAWLYAAVTVAAMLLQFFIYGSYFMIYAATLVALVMYVIIMQTNTERYYRQEAENAQLKVDIMLSQIQPHFLYNTLSAIQDLCHSDPPQAEAAIIKFSRYLRGNMDAIRAEHAVSFEQELTHTRGYLDLEKMRFEDKLEVRYDIQCNDFRLPTLSLQPIVENAVRHGVRGNPGGAGVVTIATRERPDCYEISVTDDGPGFRPDDTGRPHIGIQNVRERLSRMCGGTLSIASAPGRGTVVTFILPKSKQWRGDLP